MHFFQPPMSFKKKTSNLVHGRPAAHGRAGHKGRATLHTLVLESLAKVAQVGGKLGGRGVIGTRDTNAGAAIVALALVALVGGGEVHGARRKTALEAVLRDAADVRRAPHVLALVLTHVTWAKATHLDHPVPTDQLQQPDVRPRWHGHWALDQHQRPQLRQAAVELKLRQAQQLAARDSLREVGEEEQQGCVVPLCSRSPR